MGYIFDAMERSDATGKPGIAGTAEGSTPASEQVLPENLGPASLTDIAEGTPRLRMTGEEAVASAPIAAEPKAAADIVEVDDCLVALTDPSCIMAEEYRAIRTGLLAQWQNKRHLIHTITSATPREGKTITSLNLGLSLAELPDRKTVVVEADLRLPKFHRLLSGHTGPGLVDLLEGRCQLAQALRTVGPNHLSVISAGHSAGDRAVQILSSEAMLALLKDLRRRFDHVIIDTPPVLELADAGILGAWSDEVLMVARMNLTPQPLVMQAIRTLASYNAPVTGLIATDHQRPSRHYSRHGYYRYYRQSRAKAA